MSQTLTEKATSRWGTFIWREYLAKDVPGAKRFYGELLGWTFQDVEINGHAISLIHLGERRIGTIKATGETPIPGHWLSLVSVEDVDAKVQVVLEAGGKVVVSPMDVPDRGRFAVIADPQGAVLGLYHRLHGDPDPRLEVGHFCWETLLTRDVMAANGFYQQLFGWVGKPGYEEPDQIFHLGDTWVANSAPAPEGVPSHWTPYLLVSDVAQARAKAVRGGARVLVQQVDFAYGSFTVLMDPWGAPFCLHQGKMPED